MEVSPDKIMRPSGEIFNCCKCENIRQTGGFGRKIIGDFPKPCIRLDTSALTINNRRFVAPVAFIV
jgi:hypothetical protein